MILKSLKSIFLFSNCQTVWLNPGGNIKSLTSRFNIAVCNVTLNNPVGKKYIELDIKPRLYVTLNNYYIMPSRKSTVFQNILAIIAPFSKLILT